MKEIFLLSIIILFMIIITNCGDSSKDDLKDSGEGSSTNFQKRYGVKSGIIEYELSGSQEGTKTLYFDGWGMRQAEYSRSILNVGGFTKAMNLVNIIDGEYQYIINLDQKSGTKVRNPILKELEALKHEKNFSEFGEQLLLKMGAEKIGTDNFLGKDCDIYVLKNSGTKLWVWKWLTLKSETISRGINITLTAKKIDENISIPSGKFSVPEKVVLNEVDLDNIENEMREENK